MGVSVHFKKYIFVLISCTGRKQTGTGCFLVRIIRSVTRDVINWIGCSS